jgi:hypothetical protein
MNDHPASMSVNLNFFYLECLGGWLAEATNSAGEVLAATHTWASRDDCLRELFTLLAPCQVVEGETIEPRTPTRNPS